MGISAFLLKRTLLPGCQISPAFKKTKTRTKTKKNPLASDSLPATVPALSLTASLIKRLEPPRPRSLSRQPPRSTEMVLSHATESCPWPPSPLSRPLAECSPALPERAPPLTVTRPMHFSSFLRPPPEAPSDAQCSPGRYLVTTY